MQGERRCARSAPRTARPWLGRVESGLVCKTTQANPAQCLATHLDKTFGSTAAKSLFRAGRRHQGIPYFTINARQGPHPFTVRIRRVYHVGPVAWRSEYEVGGPKPPRGNRSRSGETSCRTSSVDFRWELTRDFHREVALTHFCCR